MKFQTFSAILLVSLGKTVSDLANCSPKPNSQPNSFFYPQYSPVALINLPSANGLKLVWDKGYSVIVAQEKDDFNVDYYDALSVRLQDRHFHDGDVIFNEYGGPEVNLTKLSFVAETVAVDGWPVSPMDEDQFWFKESSADLLKLVSHITGKIRIRELKRDEKIMIDYFRNQLKSKFTKLV